MSGALGTVAIEIATGVAVATGIAVKKVAIREATMISVGVYTYSNIVSIQMCFNRRDWYTIFGNSDRCANCWNRHINFAFRQ